MTSPSLADADVESALTKARRRLLPFLFLLYVVSYLDRVNVGFAALQMNAAIGLSDVTYSLGAGIFFLSYTLFEVPSNIILARVGARRWIARIMITWGIVSASMMFVQGAPAFYVLRFALGAAEAGFFPGIIYCLTRWFPSAERARAIAGFMTAVVVAGVIGGPLSGFLLSLGGAGGLAGWQWLFVLEGLPAIVLGLVVLRVLPEQPSDVSSLTGLTLAERTALTKRLEEESRSRDGGCAKPWRRDRERTRVDTRGGLLHHPGRAVRDGFLAARRSSGRPAGGSSDTRTGVLTAIPYGVAALGMVMVGRHSDRTGERRWHIAVSALVGGAAFAASAFVDGLVPSLAALSLAMLGLASMLGPFWTLATSLMTGVGAAAGIALVNSVGNIGGFVGPNIIGWFAKPRTASAPALSRWASCWPAGGLLVLAVNPPRKALV